MLFFANVPHKDVDDMSELRVLTLKVLLWPMVA